MAFNQADFYAELKSNHFYVWLFVHGWSILYTQADRKPQISVGFLQTFLPWKTKICTTKLRSALTAIFSVYTTSQHAQVFRQNCTKLRTVQLVSTISKRINNMRLHWFILGSWCKSYSFITLFSFNFKSKVSRKNWFLGFINSFSLLKETFWDTLYYWCSNWWCTQLKSGLFTFCWQLNPGLGPGYLVTI